jgi:hypothetical protein
MSPIRPRHLATVLLLAACAPDHLTSVGGRGLDPVAPSASESSLPEPHFVQAAADAPTVANPVVQFWAKKGVDQTATMYYHRDHGGRDSIPLFSLRVRAKSLLRRPDGSAIADGDSVLITLTLVDAQRLIVDCQPSGLVFASNAPARLKMSYAHADDDLNGDGTVNAVDSALVRTLMIWRQESPTAPWLLVPSNNSTGTDFIEADIGGFTGYAIAY